MKIATYFWDFNTQALAETRKILQNTQHPKFNQRMVVLLTRCDKPKEVFSFVPKNKFIASWPSVRTYWMKRERLSEHRDWWETIYEQLASAEQPDLKMRRIHSSLFYQRLGKQMREARLKMGLNQNQLAQRTGMKQPDISMIEEGKKNITLFTLHRLCKVLEIKQIELV